MPTQRKIDIVSDLKEKLAKTKSLFLTDYQGLTHQQLETLRKSLKKVEADFVIAKNRLLKIALKEWNPTSPRLRGAGNQAIEQKAAEELQEALNNPTAVLLSYGDEIAPIKELANFIKTTQLPKIKLGFFAGKKATDDDFKTLSMLPSRDVLLATLAMRLKSPIYGLHYAMNWNLTRFVVALNNVKEKKPSN